MATEPTFYSDERGVRITTTRAIFGSTTYAMANITSVVRGEDPPRRKPGIIIAILGLIILLACISFESGVGVIVGVVVLGLGILIAAKAKSTYYVKITSASGEATPLPSSKDKQHMDSIVNAINEALIKRG